MPRLVESHWTPIGTIGDFPSGGGIVYADNGGHAMIYAREGESRDDIWVWRVEDATDKAAIADYDLEEVASYTGYPLEDIERAAKSDDPIVLAQVWEGIAMTYGGLDIFGDPDWEGTHDDVWNEYAEDYNRAHGWKANPGTRKLKAKLLR